MILVLMGPPGAGKGTIAQMLTQKGWKHFSMGEALRAHVRANGKYAKQVNKILSSGNLVSDTIAISVLREHFSSLKSNKILMDGFPRNLEQGKAVETLFKKMKWSVDAYVFIDAPVDVVVKRLSHRSQCEKCGHVYGLSTKPKRAGVCNKDQGKLITRSDDKPSVIKERFRVFEKETLPLLEWASARYPVYDVDGTGAPAVVFKRVLKVIQLIQGSR